MTSEIPNEKAGRRKARLIELRDGAVYLVAFLGLVAYALIYAVAVLEPCWSGR